MSNNDILRRVRYLFDYRDPKMVEIFGHVGHQVTQTDVAKWLKKDTHFDFKELSDKELALFLNGFIIELRGKKEGDQPVAEEVLNNNIIFRKLKIALNLKDSDILAIFALVKVKISKHELSAFFRKPTQSQYRPCEDQYLRNFLQGAQLKYRPGDR